jgi:hypothetical protein
LEVAVGTASAFWEDDEVHSALDGLRGGG